MQKLDAEIVQSLARDWNFPLSDVQTARVVGFCRRLLAWNVRINLTGAGTFEALCGEHLIDSFALARVIPASLRVVDIGSGGGLPAVPFGILREDCAVTLVEPRAKRIAFLNLAVRESCRSGFHVLRSRAEGLEHEGWDVAVSRATFPVEAWLRMGVGLVRPAGLVVALASEPVCGGGGLSELVDEVRYSTSSGHLRWVGVFRS